MKFNDLILLLESEDSRKLEPAEDGLRRDDRPPQTANVNTDIYVDSENYIHRSDGPALIKNTWSDTKHYIWFKHGKKHRLDGPAEYVISTLMNAKVLDEDFFINGARYTRDEFNSYVSSLNSKKDVEMLSDLGQPFE